jgi:hypothetical protein
MSAVFLREKALRLLETKLLTVFSRRKPTLIASGSLAFQSCKKAKVVNSIGDFCLFTVRFSIPFFFLFAFLSV